MYYNFEQKEHPNPDGISIAVTRYKALDMIQFFAKQLEDRDREWITFCLPGILQEDKESNEEKARMDAIRKDNDR